MFGLFWYDVRFNEILLASKELGWSRLTCTWVESVWWWNLLGMDMNFLGKMISRIKDQV